MKRVYLGMYLKSRIQLVKKGWVLFRLTKQLQFIVGLLLGIILVQQGLVIILIVPVLWLLGRWSRVVLVVGWFAGWLIGFGYLQYMNTLEQLELPTEFVGEVMELEGAEELEQQVVLRLDSGHKVLVTLPLYPELNPGDRLAFTGSSQSVDDLDVGYAGYLRSREIGYILRSYTFEVLSRNGGITSIANHLRDAFLEKINAHLDPPKSDLLSGILIGTSGEFSSELKEELRLSGLSHIVAVSGSNVSILVILGMSLAGLIHRKLLFVIVSAAVILFLFIVGPGNLPALRAVIMGLILLFGLYFGRKSIISFGLLYAVAIMLVISPVTWQNISFQLSVAAMLAMIVIYSRLKVLLPNSPKVLMEGLGVSMAVTLVTFPILIGSFGTIPLLGIVANLLVVPLVPIVMLLGMAAVVSSFGIPVLASFLFWLVSQLLSIILLVAKFFAGQEFGQLNFEHSTGSALLLSLLLILAIDVIAFIRTLPKPKFRPALES